MLQLGLRDSKKHEAGQAAATFIKILQLFFQSRQHLCTSTTDTPQIIKRISTVILRQNTQTNDSQFHTKRCFYDGTIIRKASQYNLFIS